MRSVDMKSLWHVPMIAGLFLSCATTPMAESVTRQTGRPCPSPRYVEFLDGSQFFQLTGRLVSRHGSNTLHPVSSAKFLYWEARDNPKAKPLKLTLDDAGEFSVEIGLPWSKQLACRDDQVVETQYVSEQHLVIRAHGCSDLKLTVGPKWLPRDVELDCRALRRTG